MMIDWEMAGKIATVFATLWLARFLWKNAGHPASLTVEAERDVCREVVQALGQHHPSVGDYEDQYDDAGASVVYAIHLNQAASGL